jgi:hypothetical protein
MSNLSAFYGLFRYCEAQMEKDKARAFDLILNDDADITFPN